MASTNPCPRCGTAVEGEDGACTRCGTIFVDLPKGAPDPGSEPPPDLPERYAVQRLLGRSRIGRVYLCRDARLEVDVAVKVLPVEISSDEKARARIESEARLAARLRGWPGILPLYGFEHHGETWFLVMEYAAGGSLFDRLRDEKRLPERGCRRVGAEIADALAYAHERGVLHRDIKPGNVLLDLAGRVKVADFGLARVLPSSVAGPSRFPVEGTPVYMPPEVIRDGAGDPRSDLYALGATLYEIATGTPPFRGSYSQIASEKTAPGARAPDPRAANPTLSAEFAAVVRRLMDPDPGNRFPSAAEAARALREDLPAVAVAPVLAEAPVVAGERDDGTGPRALPAGTVLRSAGRRPARRRGFPWVAAVAGAALLTAAVALWSLGKEPPDAAPPETATAPPAEDPSETLFSEGLVVVTRPAGAEVFVDGKLAGTTTSKEGLRVEGAAPDEPHTVTAKLRDHEPDEESGVVWRKGEPRLPVVLKLVPRRGLFSATGGRPGATVTLRRDGEPARRWTMREDGTVPPELVEAGTYEVSVEAEGCVPWTATVRVAAGTNPPLEPALREMEGTLSVDSSPPGATVRLQDEVLGTTPLAGVALPPGEHRLRLEHPEATRMEVDAAIRPGKATDLGTVVLAPLATLDLAALPEGVTATVDGKEAAGILRRPPGRIAVVLSRPGHEDQELEVFLVSGRNSLPGLRPWKSRPAMLDFTGLPPEVARVVLDARPRAPPWGTVQVSPGRHDLLYIGRDRPILAGAVDGVAGEVVAVPAPDWSEPSRVETFRAAVLPGGEESVEAALAWLRRHQSPDGSWDPVEFGKQCKGARCDGPGARFCDTGLTAMATLAFLWSGRARAGDYDGLAAWGGLEWLARTQDGEGCVGARTGDPMEGDGHLTLSSSFRPSAMALSRDSHFVYGHALGTMALVEGYRLTGAPFLESRAQRAVDFAVRCQNPYLAWRYGIRPQDNDTSVTAWMVLALRMAAEAGLRVDAAAFASARAWVDKVTEPEYGRAGYTVRGNGPVRAGSAYESFPGDRVESCTAMAIATRLACGSTSADEMLPKGADLCLRSRPVWDEAAGTVDLIYWFFGTMALNTAPLDARKPRSPWISEVSHALRLNQNLDRRSDRHGSWDPVGAWGGVGGRVYSTALATLTLLAPSSRILPGPSVETPTRISLDSDPPGAEVFLDGHPLGRTPLRRRNTTPGVHDLRITHPARGDLERRISLSAFRELDLGTVALPPGASLDLSGVEQGITVLVSGRPAPETAAVRPGRVEVAFLRAGFRPQVEILRLEPGGEARPRPREWEEAPPWEGAAVPSLPAPPRADLGGIRLPAGFVDRGGRIFCGKDGTEVVLLPAGAPSGGASPGAAPLPALLVDRHEVTVAQFTRYAEATGARIPGAITGSGPDHPVVNLSVDEAKAYAAWAGRRLPRAAEWERIRDWTPPGISRSALGGGAMDDPATRNLRGKDDGFLRTAPVGSFPLGMSRLGCLDLLGNAAEWCLEPTPTVRGGAWNSADDSADKVPGSGGIAVGFRCVVDLPEE